jgi:NAD(P)-dependent dehydrogenase (short-subunit alcohol dehydrogenase family)
MKTQKVIFITGASKGFGFQIAKAALAAGDKVVATVRSKAARLTDVFNNDPNLFVVNMNVTNEEHRRCTCP